MGGISGKLKRALWPLVEARARELDAQRQRGRRKATKVCAILFAITFLLSSVGVAAAEIKNEDFEFTFENEWPSAILTVQTTPVTGEVFVNENSWGPAPQTRRLNPGTYTVSFGEVDGYRTPDPQGVALDRGDSITVIGVYTLISGPEPTGEPTGGGESNPDFSVSISPSSRTIARGESTNYSITVRSIGGFSGRVEFSLSGTPSGSSYSMLSSVLVQYDGVSVLGLTISTTSSTPAGEYTLTVAGVNGGLTRSASAALVVTADTGNPTPPNTDNDDNHNPIPPEENQDFTVSISPDWKRVVNKINVCEYASVKQVVDEWGSGASKISVNREAKYTVTVTSVNGFSGTVSLSTSGVPSGASHSLPSSVYVQPYGQAISTLTVTTTSSTPSGDHILDEKSYTLTVTGTNGGVTRSDSAELKVKAEWVETKTAPAGGGYDGGGLSKAASQMGRVLSPGRNGMAVTNMLRDDWYASGKPNNPYDGANRVSAVDRYIVEPLNKAAGWVNRNIVQPVVNAGKNLVNTVINNLKSATSNLSGSVRQRASAVMEIMRPLPLVPLGLRFR